MIPACIKYLLIGPNCPLNNCWKFNCEIKAGTAHGKIKILRQIFLPTTRLLFKITAWNNPKKNGAAVEITAKIIVHKNTFQKV